MKNWTIGVLSCVCFICLSIVFSSNRTFTKADELGQANLPQVIKSVPIADYVDLAGERVPTDRHDVKERLDRELMVNGYWHSNTIQAIKVSYRFFPTIERILAEEGVPDDFKYLAVAESDLRLKTSYAGAKGYWQFMKASGKQYKLEINDEVDERYHIEKSTRAAAKYIKTMKKRFGSWTAAAAAYNVGPTRYKRIMAQQGSNNYYDLNLNDETSRYVFRVLAFKYILSNQESFGFYIPAEERYQPLSNYRTVTVKKSVADWSVFAKENGVSYRDLKIYNPWLIDSKLTVISNTYEIKIPIL
ncbi:lytic transglycosylase domain-containing protein [Saprospiraceae bacterium]|nr:lytic transglycosylase domain-containing protein [Saprospiraceae bacterium]